MTDLQRIQEIAAREKAATTGDWKVTATGGDVMTPGASDILIGAPHHWIARLFHPESHVAGTTSRAPSPEEALANADFIAHAREDILYLRAQLQEAQEERDRAWHWCAATNERSTKVLEDAREAIERAERAEALACKRENCALREPTAEALEQRAADAPGVPDDPEA